MRAAGVTAAGAALVADLVVWLDNAWPTRESFLRHVNERRPTLRLTKQRLSKELGSRHKPHGPEWNIVELIIRESVPAAHQEEVLATVAGLYCVARGRLGIPGYDGPIAWPPGVAAAEYHGQNRQRGMAARVAGGDTAAVPSARENPPVGSDVILSSGAGDATSDDRDDRMSTHADDMPATGDARPGRLDNVVHLAGGAIRLGRRRGTPTLHRRQVLGWRAFVAATAILAAMTPILVAAQAPPALIGFLCGVVSCLAIYAVRLACSQHRVVPPAPGASEPGHAAVRPDQLHRQPNHPQPHHAAVIVQTGSDRTPPPPTSPTSRQDEIFARLAFPRDATENLWIAPRVRYLMIAGLSGEAAYLAEQICAGASDPYDRAYARALHVVALINLGRIDESTEVLTEALDMIRNRPEPHLHGQTHATAAIIASQRGDMERVVDHLGQAAKALGAANTNSPDSAHCWHDLAQAYSYSGFHKLAIQAIDRSRRIGANCGVPDELCATPGVLLRLATWQDQHGDTESCTRILRSIVSDLGRLQHRGTLSRLRPSDTASYGYAGARLEALGVPTAVDIAPLLPTSTTSLRTRDLATLADICLAIGNGRTTEAIDKIETAQVSPDTAGRGEITRLRALALETRDEKRRDEQLTPLNRPRY